MKKLLFILVLGCGAADLEKAKSAIDTAKSTLQKTELTCIGLKSALVMAQADRGTLCQLAEGYEAANAEEAAKPLRYVCDRSAYITQIADDAATVCSYASQLQRIVSPDPIATRQ